MTRNECLNFVQMIIESHNQTFPKYRVDMPEVGFYVTGKTAGKAYTKINKIEFNLAIMAEQECNVFVNTIKHEIAHRIADTYYPNAKQAHGPEWKYFMRLLGAEAVRCHSYSTDNCVTNKVKRYEYQCSCGTPHKMSTQIHNKFQNNKDYYRVCNYSKYQLTYKDFTGKIIIK